MRLFAVCSVLVAAFIVALLVGRAGGDPEENAAASAEIETINLPDGSARAPQAEDPGKIPDLQPKPQATSTPSTGSTSTSTSTSTSSTQASTPSAGTTEPSSGGGGGGGETPPPPVPR